MKPEIRPAVSAPGPWKLLQTVLRVVLGGVLWGATLLLLAPIVLTLYLVLVTAGRTLLGRPAGA